VALFRRSAGGKSSLGRRGEKLATRFLRRRGLKILARNYHCPAGEVDLIALDASTRGQIGAETIAVVEVKTRTSDRYADPEARVDQAKRRKLRKVAAHYVSAHDAEDLNVRFDIVSLVLADGREPQIKYIPNAF